MGSAYFGQKMVGQKRLVEIFFWKKLLLQGKAYEMEGEAVNPHAEPRVQTAL